jgi:multiple sugar transport system permease protein
MRRLTPYLFVLPAVAFLGALLVYPVVLNVLMSFQDVSAGNLLGGAEWIGFENYRAAFADEVFVDAAWHSVTYAAVSVVVQLVAGTGLALFYAQSFPGARALRSLYMIAYAIPVVVSAELFRWLLDGRSGFVNWALGTRDVFWLADTSLALPAVIGIQVWLGVPFVMVSLTAGLVAIPREFGEAALIDGASAWQRFRWVTWPLLRPVVAATAVLSTIFTLKSFDLVWIATQGGPAGASEILPTLAYRLVFTSFLFGKGAAIMNVIFFVLFVLSLLYLRTDRRTP